MTEKPVTRKFLKIIAYVLAGIIVLLTIFHFWFVNHAEEIIENMVSSQSNGKVKLKVKKFKFNWFSHKMELQNAVFYSPDTADATVGYRFEVDRMKIQVSAVLPIVFEKKIYIDSLHLFNPNITVTRFRLSADTTTSDTSLSIPYEMGRIYNSIQDALQVLKVERFQIDNGSFSLVNKTRPNEKPVTITRLNFHLDNLQVDSTKQNGERKILFSDNVALQTTHQDILLPDGRHRLSFANFRINILSRLVEFDSCNIVAIKGDGGKSSFSIFFDKLKMTNINFDTLYRSEVIKADSVYCINPRFRLDVDLAKKEGLSKPPPLNEMIQQLTGDMQLAFVVVENGSFDINTVREGRPSSFTSDHNNFELQGLRIQKNVPKPLTVERFAMAIRNYENFLRDSTYAIQFDSILLNNNRISLSNFSYKELREDKIINQVAMPQFELYGLSWDDLIFDQRLKAARVTLYHPVINYDLTKERKGVRNIFSNLSNLSQIMQLDRLDVVDGQVNLAMKNGGYLKLENATIYLRGQKLVAARELTGIKNAVEYLNVKKGSLEMGDLKTNFTNVDFNSINNKLEAGTISFNRKDQLDIQAKNISLRSLQIDAKGKSLALDGIKWEQATVHIQKSKSPLGSTPGNQVSLKNIDGQNTTISFKDNARGINLFLSRINANEFNSGTAGGVDIKGLHAKGNKFEMMNNSSRLTVGSFDLVDLKPSSLSDLHYTAKSGTDSSRVSVPTISLMADFNQMIKGKIIADNIAIVDPELQISAVAKNDFGSIEHSPLPESHISKLTISRPNLRLKSSSDRGNSSLIWNGKENNNDLELNDVITGNDGGAHVSVGGLKLNLDHFIFTSVKGRAFNAGKGKLNAELSAIEFSRNEENAWDWKGSINNLTANNFIVDSIGKKIGKLSINTAVVNDLAINSASLINLRELMTHNTQFRLREVTGSYRDKVDQYEWRNAAYDKRTRRFSLDSLSYHPIDDKATYVKRQPYQSDYLIATTGRIDIGPFDVERYIRDTVLDMGKVSVQNGKLIDFRDKRVGRKPGTVTLLPATILKNIPLRFMADTVKIINSAVDYEEVNEKNSQAGRITVERMNGRVIRLRNFGLSNTDSLDIRAMGYLQDKIFTRLSLKQSYSDTMGGFLMTGQMGPADLTVLNPVLKPLVSIELKSASLDSMQMRVIGTEPVAYGNMQLFYHDLKVKVARSGKKEKSVLNGLLNFLANSLVKNKNADKTGLIYFKRFKDRSAINYLVKITLSGFVSNVGIKSNKRAIRKLQKNAKKNQLPPIETE